MSQRPFGFNTRQALMDNYSYERAAPRTSGQGEKRYHHPVIPISSASTTPHYAQASQLYPMRTSSERDGLYKYKPGSLGTTGSSQTYSTVSGSTSGSNQPVPIPVLHLSQPRTTLTSPTGHGSSSAQINTTTTPNPSSPISSISDSGDLNYRTSNFRTQSADLLSNSSRSLGRRTAQTNDQEAEVDALTNLLMQSIETKSSSSGLGTSMTSSTNANLNGGSPAGTFRRGSGSSLPLSYNSQIGRLQQHLGLSSGSASLGSANGGRGSPLTTGIPAAASSVTGSSSTNSPTGSTSSIHNPSEQSTGTTIGNQSSLQNTCYRCRRPLAPPEGSTLNSTTGSSNVVTLSGALAVRLHVACFNCYRCAAPLRPDAYYHSLRRLLCPACVRDGAVETCSNCRRPIGDRVVHALGLPYHPNCFVCVVCASRLDCRPFTIDVHGRLHCLDDFHRRYAPRCAQCGRPIAPDPGSQEARRVVSGDSNYHLECFGVQAVPSTNTTKMTKSIAA